MHTDMYVYMYIYVHMSKTLQLHLIVMKWLLEAYSRKCMLVANLNRIKFVVEVVLFQLNTI